MSFDTRNFNCIIGILGLTAKISDFNKIKMKLARSYNINAYYFIQQNIDIKNRKVMAVLWNGNEFIKEIIDLPYIIDNPVQRHIEKNLLKYLKESCFFLNGSAYNKKNIPNVLHRGKYEYLSIPTFPWEKYNKIQELFKVWDELVIKPVNGRQGKNIRRIKKNNNSYILYEKDKLDVYDNKSLEEFYNEINESDGKYILQPYLSFVDKENHAIDYRLLVARGENGTFKPVAVYPRIGNNPVVSNIGQGGHIADLESFVQNVYKENSQYILEQINSIANNFPEYYQRLCKEHITYLGLDIGVDIKTTQIYLIEANTFPLAKYNKWDLAETIVQYYKFLLLKKNSNKKDI